jgi:molybdopterin synthase sulfur carrier subunit
VTDSVVLVKFFASLREAVGVAQCEVSATDLNEVLAELKARFEPAVFAELTADNVRIAVNADMIEGNARLKAGDEIAFLPPVTGG